MRRTTFAQDDKYAASVHAAYRDTYDPPFCRRDTFSRFVASHCHTGVHSKGSEHGLAVLKQKQKVCETYFILEKLCVSFSLCRAEELCGYKMFKYNVLFITCFLSFVFLVAKVITFSCLESWSWSSYHCLQVFLFNFTSNVMWPHADRRKSENNL